MFHPKNQTPGAWGTLRWTTLAVLLASMLACGDGPAPSEPEVTEPTPPPPSGIVPPTDARLLQIARIAGDDQVAVVGSTLPGAIVVRVTDAGGAPVPGTAVAFNVTWGSGLLEGQQGRTITTDANGVASTAWTLGPTAQTNLVTAVIAEDVARSVEFRANARADIPVRLIYWGGTRAAQVGTSVTNAPAVAAVDRFGNRVPGVPVTFTAADDGGSLTGGAAAVTDAFGVARSGPWTVGTRAGVYTVTATSPGLESFVFTATGYAGPAAAMEIVAGNGQQAPVMTEVPIAPAIRVMDQYGNPVSGALISFTFGGEFTTPAFAHPPITGADGIVRVTGWRLGHRPGIYSITAKSGSFSVRFDATAVAGPPARLLVLDGNFQVAPPGATLLTSPAVWIADAYGNRVSRAGVPVTFTVREGGGSVTGNITTTDVNGVARVGSWTLGPATVVNGFAQQTTNRLIVESPGFPSLELVAIAR